MCYNCGHEVDREAQAPATPAQFDCLLATLAVANQCCNAISETAFREKSFSVCPCVSLIFAPVNSVKREKKTITFYVSRYRLLKSGL